MPCQHLAVPGTKTFHSITHSFRLEWPSEVIWSNLLRRAGPIIMDCSGLSSIRFWTSSRAEIPQPLWVPPGIFNHCHGKTFLFISNGNCSFPFWEIRLILVYSPPLHSQLHMFNWLKARHIFWQNIVIRWGQNLDIWFSGGWSLELVLILI